MTKLPRLCRSTGSSGVMGPMKIQSPDGCPQIHCQSTNCASLLKLHFPAYAGWRCPSCIPRRLMICQNNSRDRSPDDLENNSESAFKKTEDMTDRVL